MNVDREKMLSSSKSARKATRRLSLHRKKTLSPRIKACRLDRFKSATFTMETTKINRAYYDTLYHTLVDRIKAFADDNRCAISKAAMKKIVHGMMPNRKLEDVEALFDYAEKVYAEYTGTNDVVVIAPKKKSKQRTGPAAFESKFKNKRSS